jgi:hypothetical protein
MKSLLSKSDRKHLLEFIENVNTITWFLMDAFWMMEWSVIAHVMAVPVIVTGFLIVAISERVAHTVLAHISLNCWILMNVFWMSGDLMGVRSLVLIAKILFFTGLCMLFFSVLMPGKKNKTLSAFRRFKIK